MIQNNMIQYFIWSDQWISWIDLHYILNFWNVIKLYWPSPHYMIMNSIVLIKMHNGMIFFEWKVVGPNSILIYFLLIKKFTNYAHNCV
jgi:hypothetical protein